MEEGEGVASSVVGFLNVQTKKRDGIPQLRRRGRDYLQ
jgi:hypothetical protein